MRPWSARRLHPMIRPRTHREATRGRSSSPCGKTDGIASMTMPSCVQIPNTDSAADFPLREDEPSLRRSSVCPQGQATGDDESAVLAAMMPYGKMPARAGAQAWSTKERLPRPPTSPILMEPDPRGMRSSSCVYWKGSPPAVAYSPTDQPRDPSAWCAEVAPTAQNHVLHPRLFGFRTWTPPPGTGDLPLLEVPPVQNP